MEIWRKGEERLTWHNWHCVQFELDDKWVVGRLMNALVPLFYIRKETIASGV